MPVVINDELKACQSRCSECGGRCITLYNITTDTFETRLVDPDDDYCKGCYEASNRKFTKHVHEV